ncbi:hypothetical protein [Microvirga sp. TS319]|uniref:hypothetical protein n=1 Tax=Microvirga sp. TS319 TaxID=3241165 RepID=UPI00351A5869
MKAEPQSTLLMRIAWLERELAALEAEIVRIQWIKSLNRADTMTLLLEGARTSQEACTLKRGIRQALLYAFNIQYREERP